MINISTALLRRISNVNHVRIADINLIYQNLDEKGHGSFCCSISGRRHGTGQVYIPEILGQALVAGERNKNLDNKLRF